MNYFVPPRRDAEDLFSEAWLDFNSDHDPAIPEAAEAAAARCCALVPADVTAGEAMVEGVAEAGVVVVVYSGVELKIPIEDSSRLVVSIAMCTRRTSV